MKASTISKMPFRFGEFVVEPDQNRVSTNERQIAVEKKNMDLLTYLALNHDRVISSEELLDNVWSGRIVEDSTIHRRISQLRKLLGDSARSPQYIRTINKRGYQAIADVSMATGAGRVIKNRFRIEGEPIGEDEFGEVFRAIDLRQKEDNVNNPYIAIKILKREFISSAKDLGLTETTARYRKLTHPNIMSVFDFDRDGDVVFLTMPLLEGMRFDQYLHKHREAITKEQAHAIGQQICDAMSYAHANNAVHGALRPGAMFYTSRNELKVFDIGVPINEKNDYGGGSSDPKAYASPEVLAGKVPEASDDIYAAGILIWELVSGTHPFDYRTAEAPGRRSDLPTSIEPALGNLLALALEHDRDDRKVTMTQLRDQLSVLLSNSNHASG